MDGCFEASDYDDVLQIFDEEKLHQILHEEDEINIFDMTSLGDMLLLEQNSKSTDAKNDDSCLRRLSLAHERLRSIPKILIPQLAPFVKILDISYNEFENLDFLTEFTELTYLICDHNNITSNTGIPFLPKLELLWLNHCKIRELYPWARKLQHSCPNLKYLSLMGNPVAPSYLNGGTFYEYLHYRLFIISLFPDLVHLDDKLVTSDQRAQAQKMYHRPLIERLVTRTHQNLPEYLRVVSERFMAMLSPLPSGFDDKPKKNVIV